MNENARAWVAALRSGEYRQGEGYLTQHTPHGDLDCCLGVACKLAVQSGVDVEVEVIRADDGNEVVAYGLNSRTLPFAVRDWLGLASCDGYPGGFPGPGPSLVTLNDSGTPFSQIAHFIESEAGGLFVKDAA